MSSEILHQNERKDFDDQLFCYSSILVAHALLLFIQFCF